MILRWEQGRDTVDRLLAERRLERIPANRELADLYLEQARAHLRTSRSARSAGCAQFGTTASTHPSTVRSQRMPTRKQAGLPPTP